jgi:hypothetical protein
MLGRPAGSGFADLYFICTSRLVENVGTTLTLFRDLEDFFLTFIFARQKEKGIPPYLPTSYAIVY